MENLVEVELYNGLGLVDGRWDGYSPENAAVALNGIRKGTLDSISSVSEIKSGKVEDFPTWERKNWTFFYETNINPQIEEAIKITRRGYKINMPTLLTNLPYPDSWRASTRYQRVEGRHLIVIPFENTSKEMDLPTAHWGNEISVISVYDLAKEQPSEDIIFNQGVVMGAHMTGHLLSLELEDSHCEDSGCCMHPHSNGLKDINEIIKIRERGNRKELFCEKTLNQFRKHLSSN